MISLTVRMPSGNHGSNSCRRFLCATRNCSETACPPNCFLRFSGHRDCMLLPFGSLCSSLAGSLAGWLAHSLARSLAGRQADSTNLALNAVLRPPFRVRQGTLKPHRAERDGPPTQQSQAESRAIVVPSSCCARRPACLLA